MQYLLLIHGYETGENAPKLEDVAQIIEAVNRFDSELTEAGKNIGSIRLLPSSTAKVVRSRNKKVMVTDGPFAETKEQLGGIYIFDAENDEEAVQIAQKLPMTEFGSVEIRAVVGIDIRKAVFEQYG